MCGRLTAHIVKAEYKWSRDEERTSTFSDSFQHCERVLVDWMFQEKNRWERNDLLGNITSILIVTVIATSDDVERLQKHSTNIFDRISCLNYQTEFIFACWLALRLSIVCSFVGCVEYLAFKWNVSVQCLFIFTVWLIMFSQKYRNSKKQCEWVMKLFRYPMDCRVNLLKSFCGRCDVRNLVDIAGFNSHWLSFLMGL